MTYKGIEVVPTKSSHLLELWSIFQSYPDYFDDTCKINTFKEFKKQYKQNVISSLTGIKDGEVIGCAYIDNIHKSLGNINIIIKRKTINPVLTVALLKNFIPYLFKKHNLKMLYAITRVNNLACLRLLKNTGFKITETLKDHEILNGIKIDCVIASILREQVEG